MTANASPALCRHGLMSGDGCRRDVAFPECPDNRPGLPRIERRVGTYAEIRAYLVDRLNREPVLRTWTHRQPDDPGIALLEGSAILGDILTFYQELYANEAYLRTATWRESVGALVKLLGYRLSPGVGGRGVFAIEVRGSDPVTVPAGLPLTAQVRGLEAPADLQTSAAIVAYPWLSRLNLYRPLTTPVIDGATRELVVSGTGAAPDIQKGQRLLVGPGGSGLDWDAAEIVVVDAVRQRLGETLVTIKGGLRQVVPAQALVAYRIGRSFRHFGHNAPPTIAVADSQGKVKNDPVGFDRNLGAWTDADGKGRASIAPGDVPLDTTVSDLAAGTTVICQVTPPPIDERGVLVQLALDNLPPPPPISYSSAPSDPFGNVGSFIEAAFVTILGAEDPEPPRPPGGRPVTQAPLVGTLGSARRYLFGDQPRTVVRTIAAVRQSSLTWGSLSGPSTVVALDAPMSSDTDQFASIANIQVHEATSPLLRLVAAEVPTSAASGSHVGIVATANEASVLPGRRLLIVPPAGRPTLVTVQDLDPPPADVTATARRLRSIRLDVVVPFADLGPDGSSVVVHGNLVDATQGKLEREEPIGSGDGRAAFQTMLIPKNPLTYLTTPGNTPPETPELEVFVDGRRWARVPSLFGAGATDEVYIVREDDDGRSWVQFGDGKTGRRLPSGVDNVVVRFRTGVAAHGPLRPETSVQAGGRVERLDKVRLPGELTGGAEPEDRDSARAAAPGKVQSLDRLVSLRDFETETLAIPGVARVRAAWRLIDNVPAAVVTVLMATGRETEFEQVRGIVAASDRRRGAARFPVLVVSGRRRYFGLTLTVATTGRLRDEVVLDAVRRELGTAGIDDGMDGTAWRTFGEREHATRIEGRVQAVDGVRWTRVDTIQINPTLLDLADWGGWIGRPGPTASRAPGGAAITRIGRAGSAIASAPIAISQLAASIALASPARRLALDAIEERAVVRLGGARLRDLAERFGRRPPPTRVLTPGPDEILALRADDLSVALVSTAPTGTDR